MNGTDAETSTMRSQTPASMAAVLGQAGEHVLHRCLARYWSVGPEKSRYNRPKSSTRAAFHVRNRR